MTRDARDAAVEVVLSDGPTERAVPERVVVLEVVVDVTRRRAWADDIGSPQVLLLLIRQSCARVRVVVGRRKRGKVVRRWACACRKGRECRIITNYGVVVVVVIGVVVAEGSVEAGTIRCEPLFRVYGRKLIRGKTGSWAMNGWR